MMVRKIEEGWDATRAATFAYEATAMPMLTGTLITAVGFLPIGMAQSTVGEYTFAIFAVTAAALIISWVVSVYFVPYLGTLLLKVKPHAAGEEPHELFDTPFYNRFRTLVRACVRHRWITIALTIGTLVLGIMGMGQVQQQFFPSSTRLEVLVDMWYPEGTSFAANEAVTKRLEARVMTLDGVDHVTTWVGSGAERFALVLDQIFPNTNVSQLVVLAKDLPARERIRLQLPEILAKEFPEARGRALLLQNGPPVAYPVQFRLEGPDPAQLRVYADQVKTIMRAHPNMQGVNDNWNESVKSLRLEVDQDKARALGVSSSGIAQAIRIANVGSTIGQYRDGDKLIDIVLRQENGEKGRLNDLTGVYVPTNAGAAVPLSQVVKARFAWEPGVLWREGRDYAVTVQGDVSEGMQGATLSAQIDPLLDAIRQKMQPGYRIQVAGAVEESSKGQGSIAVGAPLMLFIMFTLLMLQLHSFSRAVLVFLTGPMGIAGVAAALLISGRPFGFVALLGVIALSGMIMRNSVILIDQIEQDRANGMPAWEAVVEAAVRRFRPILLTAAAAVLAMIPLTRSVFWGPMATAIMGGLVVATFLTLLALPAMYAAWFRIKLP
jgi:multidrug efflux pump